MNRLNIDIHNEVYLIPWKEEWAHIFLVEKQNILAALAASEHTADIRHVGSTSVRGMVAKPIIDIQICPDRGIPLEAIALVAGIDRVMDMARTTINVLGDATAAIFISRTENDFDPQRGAALQDE